MKRTFLTLAASAALALGAPAAQAQKIGLAMAQLDTFLTILKDGTLDAAKKAGATVQVEDAQNDVGKQLSQIQNFIAQKVDAIIVNPVDTDATPKMTKMVTDAKIPLIYVNRKPVDFDKLPAGVAFVASDERVSGTLETQGSLPGAEGQGQHRRADGRAVQRSGPHAHQRHRGSGRDRRVQRHRRSSTSARASGRARTRRTS